MKEEISRRRIQQKARKTDRTFAHQKFVSRVLAKKHLIGLRECAMLTLHEMGLMQPKVKRALAEDVLPWLIEKTQGFLDEDSGAATVTEQVIT